jgi:hypothetical protein
MIAGTADFSFKKLLTYVDWKLLMFLVLFLNVKLEVKIPAIILIYILQFNFKFGFSLKNSRLPLFYLLVIGIAFIGLLLNNLYAPHYLLVFAIGVGFWLLCLLAIHQVKLAVDNNTTETLHNTILVFFIINAAFSFFTMAHIMLETHSLNPYRYQGEYQKYFIGTGDYIKGLTFDTSTTNAVLSAFGVVYFLIRKNPVMLLLCMVVLLLTGSNFINIVLMVILLGLFVFKSGKNQKSLMMICVMLLVVFMSQVSPQSNAYVYETIKNTIHPQHFSPSTANVVKLPKMPAADEVKITFAKHYLDSVKAKLNYHKAVDQKLGIIKNIPKTDAGRVFIVPPDINTPPYQTPTDTVPEQRKLLAFIALNKDKLPVSRKNILILPTPGKIMSLQQSVRYLKQHPVKIMAGDGIGNFSSKLAFRTTALGFAGSYPAKLLYISKEFFSNHLDLYLNFFSKRTGLHSLTNSPYSVYDQLLAEYGLLGIVAFAIFYLGYFIKDYKKLTYGIPLLGLVLTIFFMDYWFEQLSVVVFFELLLLLNIKEHTNLKPMNYEY